MATWRQHCAPIIAKVIQDNPDLSGKALRAKINEVYPYGQRSLHPYKIWCSEVNKQMGVLTKKQIAERESKGNPNQQKLF